MNEQKGTGTSLESLLDMLASEDGVIREQAREALVALGKPAVASLIQALQNSRLDQLRWEAAEALGSINDMRSLPSLVKALEDSNSDVAWVAADALKTFRKAAWPPLLQALIKSRSNSVALRKGVHHVLVDQQEDGFNDLLATLLKALESSSAPESSALAAHEILQRLNECKSMNNHSPTNSRSYCPVQDIPLAGNI
jgi:HEAT repeat protein